MKYFCKRSFGAVETDRSMGVFLLQINYVRADLGVISLEKMLTGVSAAGPVACGLGHDVTSGKDSSVGPQ